MNTQYVTEADPELEALLDAQACDPIDDRVAQRLFELERDTLLQSLSTDARLAVARQLRVKAAELAATLRVVEAASNAVFDA